MNNITEEANKTINNSQYKCPKCGSTHILLNESKGALVCHFCRHEFTYEQELIEKGRARDLEGTIIGTGAASIKSDAENIFTLKCNSCAAEVVLDTSEILHAKCHWCRNILSINDQVPNGAIPDMVLPFMVTKEEARGVIEEFVNDRNFFADAKFKQEFCLENIKGVYLPFMVVDINAKGNLTGETTKVISTPIESKNTLQQNVLQQEKRKVITYNTTYTIDLFIENLTIISKESKLDKNSKSQTNNIINAIKPFDLENCVKWNTNFLKGYTTEKRDTNIDGLRDHVNTKSISIAQERLKEQTITQNRSAMLGIDNFDKKNQKISGIKWKSSNLEINGERWKSAYLPIWLYSYQKDKQIHYIAVNARTKRIMGSVPINRTKLIIFSVIAQVVAIIIMVQLLNIDHWGSNFAWILLLFGIMYYYSTYTKYRNKNERYKHEEVVKSEMKILNRKDEFLKQMGFH